MCVCFGIWSHDCCNQKLLWIWDFYMCACKVTCMDIRVKSMSRGIRFYCKNILNNHISKKLVSFDWNSYTFAFSIETRDDWVVEVVLSPSTHKEFSLYCAPCCINCCTKALWLLATSATCSCSSRFVQSPFRSSDNTSTKIPMPL